MRHRVQNLFSDVSDGCYREDAFITRPILQGAFSNIIETGPEKFCDYGHGRAGCRWINKIVWANKTYNVFVTEIRNCFHDLKLFGIWNYEAESYRHFSFEHLGTAFKSGFNNFHCISFFLKFKWCQHCSQNRYSPCSQLRKQFRMSLRRWIWLLCLKITSSKKNFSAVKNLQLILSVVFRFFAFLIFGWFW